MSTQRGTLRQGLADNPADLSVKTDIDGSYNNGWS